MGRNTFEPALGSPVWPWGDHHVFVLTTSELPAGTPSHVVAADKPTELLELMRAADFTGNVHLVGGQQTINAFREIGALDSFGVVTVPILLGDGLRLTPIGSGRQPLTLESGRTFPDGSVEHIYTPALA
jgi:dihydrofolate reductase